MVKPLSFKGDKKVKKRKREVNNHEEEQDEGGAQSISQVGAENEQDDNWVSAESINDISGPIVLVLPTSPASCLACDAHGKIFASAVENIIDENPATVEPHDVRQVWIATRIAGTSDLSLKGHHGRYLACDKIGLLSANREAISPEEQFVFTKIPDTPATFAVQSKREGFLTVVQGDNLALTGLRGDADAIDSHTTFRVRMQARFKPRLKADKVERAYEKVSRRELETAAGRKLDDAEVRSLKRARKDGNYYEVLLDVKVKGKHDKFA